MPLVKLFQTNFTGGEIDPSLYGRADVKAYVNGAEKLRNVELIPQGGVRRRPGTRYVAAIPAGTKARITDGITVTVPNGGTAANINDFDPETLVTTTAAISTTNPFVIVQYDLGVAKTIVHADVRNLFTNSTTESEEFRIQASADGSTWTNIGNTLAIGNPFENQGISSTKKANRRRIIPELSDDSGLQRRYWRVSRVGSTDLSTAVASLGEFWLWERQGDALSNVLLINHDFGLEQEYLLLMTDQNVIVFKDDDAQVNVYVPFPSADIPEVSYLQSLDTLLLFHEDHESFLVKRSADDDEWDSYEIPFTNLPTYTFSDTAQTTSITITPGDDGPAGVNCTLTASGNFFTFGGTTRFADTGWDLEFNGGRCRITSISSATAAVAIITRAFRDLTATVPTIREPVWSATRGWPRCGTFHEGRLYIGGSRDRPQTVWGSVVGSFFDFNPGGSLASDAVEFTLDTDAVAAITALRSGRNLQIFTQAGEFVVLPDDEPITPSNLAVKRQTEIGSPSTGFPVLGSDQATFFLNRYRNAIYEFVYAVANQGYTAQNISLLSSHLLNSPVDLAVRRATSTNQADQVFVVNGDGTLAVLCTLRNQDVTGWVLWETDGQFLSVAIVNEQIYVAVQRTVEGVETQFLEVFDPDVFMDSAAVASSFPATTIVPSWLPDTDVQVRVDGSPVDDLRSDLNGVVTLAASATTDAQCGLAFPDVVGEGNGEGVWIKDLPVFANPGDGWDPTRKKRVTEVSPRFKDTQEAYIRANDGAFQNVSFTNLGEQVLGAPPPTFSGLKRIQGMTGRSYDGQVELTQRSAAPLTVLSIAKKVVL